MKYSYVYAALLALASSTGASAQMVMEDSNGHIYVEQSVPAPAPSSTPAPAPSPVQEKVYNPPTSNPQQAPTSSVVVPPPAATSSPPVAAAPPVTHTNNLPTNNGGTFKSTPGQICVNFAGNPSFHFANAGSWGARTGQGPGSASQCFSLVPGGAMFICDSECNAAGDAAPAKYTKLECNFEGGYPNCDISLVDGFSLPLECTIPGSVPEKIGGLVDLNTLTPCPGGSAGDGTCPNRQGYAATQGEVAPFFQNANQPQQGGAAGPGGNYCVWQTCSGPSDTFWNSAGAPPTISCVVGEKGGQKASKKRAEGGVVLQERNLTEREVSGVAAHLRRHVGGAHSHARAHARGLGSVLA